MTMAPTIWPSPSYDAGGARRLAAHHRLATGAVRIRRRQRWLVVMTAGAAGFPTSILISWHAKDVITVGALSNSGL